MIKAIQWLWRKIRIYHEIPVAEFEYDWDSEDNNQNEVVTLNGTTEVVTNLDHITRVHVETDE